MKKKLLISFSGGRTSGFMTWWLMFVWEERFDYEIIVVFANTGKEQEGTLEFVQRCSVEWCIEIIWVESVPVQSKVRLNKKGVHIGGKWWGVKHKMITFETASRKGEPFELMCSKLGIPTTNVPFCSDQLKAKAIRSYARSIKWKNYEVAIGVRIDEVDRVSENYIKEKLIYPLIDKKLMTKRMVNEWWKEQPFDLDIDPDLGNCDGCWKKDMKRLVRIARNKPEVFEWWQEMTDSFGHIQNRKANSKMKPPFNFYRGNLSPKDIFKLAKLDEMQLDLFAEQEKLDGCSESCEAF